MEGERKAITAANHARWLQLLSEQVPAVLWTTDRALRITSRAGRGLKRKMFGGGELVGQPLATIFDGEHLPVAMHERALAGEQVGYQFAWQGRIYDCLVGPLREHTGEITGCAGLATDVTEEVQAAGAVALSEQRLVQAQRIAHLGTWDWDIGKNQVTWTDELYRIYGLDRQSFGATYEAFLATSVPEDVELVRSTIEGAAAHPGTFDFDHRIIRSDGSVRTLHTTGDVLVDGAGRGVRMIGTCHDVTEERYHEAELKETLSLLRTTLESTADGILVVDLHEQVVTFNQKFIDIWKLPRELLFNRDDRKLLAHVVASVAEPEAFLARVRYLYDHPDEESTDSIASADGRTFERWTQPQRLDHQVIGRIWSFRDVTARLAAEAERDRLLERERAARERAEEEVRARNEFLSVAAHELRTPITSLQLSVQGLLQNVFGLLEDSRLARPLRTIERQSRRLTRLVGDLLDLSRIDAGGLDLALAEMDLAEAAAAAATRFEEDLKQAGCPIELDLEPARGRWDRARLDQVITNLLSNAMRYGAGGPIALRVRQSGERARLMVEDHGTGIAPDKLAHIFERFERGGASRSFGGLGLGLYIARGIVERLGGTISVTSSVGQGSIFTVELLLAGPT